MLEYISKADRKIVRKSVGDLFERYRMAKFLGKAEEEFKPLIDAIYRLPEVEKKLVVAKYLSNESEYLADYQVYSYHFDPPISQVTYIKIRDRAFLKLALIFNLCPELDLLGEKGNV